MKTIIQFLGRMFAPKEQGREVERQEEAHIWTVTPHHLEPPSWPTWDTWHDMPHYESLRHGAPYMEPLPVVQPFHSTMPIKTVGDLKRAIAALPADLDDKALWYVSVIAPCPGIIHGGKNAAIGVTITETL